MIIATVATLMLLFGGNAEIVSFDIFEDPVKDSITEKARAREVVKIIETASDEMDDFTKRQKKSAKKIVHLYADYNTTREEMDVFLARTDQDREVFQEHLIELRMKIKNQVTEAEWNAIYAELPAGEKK